MSGGTGTPEGPGPRRAARRSRLLEELRRCETDSASARVEVERSARHRRRCRRTGAAAFPPLIAALALVAAGMLGGSEPDELVADRETVPGSSTTATTIAAAPATSAPLLSDEVDEVDQVVTTTTEAPFPSAPPPPPSAQPPVAPPTSPTSPAVATPTDDRLRAELRVRSPRIRAGSVATVEVTWHDPRHAGATPTRRVDWSDPGVSSTAAPPAGGRCDRTDDPGSGTEALRFRYATPGRHTVRVELATCPGAGDRERRVVVEGTVEVVDPVLDDRPGVAVVVHVGASSPPGTHVPALDRATVTFTPSDPEGAATVIGERLPTLSQRVQRSPATIVVLPAGVSGIVTLAWASTTCTATGALDPDAMSGTVAPLLAVTATC